MVTFAQTATVNFNFNSDLDAVENFIDIAPQLPGNVDYSVGINAAVISVLGSAYDGRLVLLFMLIMGLYM